MDEATRDLRRKGIGGSEAAAVLGVSRWRTPLQVYLEKIGVADGVEESEAMEWGKRLEPPILEKYCEETGRIVKPAGIVWSAEHKFMFCTADGIIEPLDGQGPGIYEGKTAIIFKEEEWEEEPPLEYQIQVQHNMAVLGYEWGSFAVLLGGQKFRWIDVERNEEFIQQLIEQLKAFWARVESRQPPEATGLDHAALARLFPQETEGETIVLPADALEWDANIAVAVAEQKQWKKIEEEHKAKMKEAIGEAEAGLLPGDQGRWKWKVQHRSGYIVEPSNPRILRRTKK